MVQASTNPAGDISSPHGCRFDFAAPVLSVRIVLKQPSELCDELQQPADVVVLYSLLNPRIRYGAAE